MAFNFKTNIDPILVPIRPLGGMIRDAPSTRIPPGHFFTLSNLYVMTDGLTKRPEYIAFSGGSQIDANDRPIIGIAPVWHTDGSQYAALLTSRYLYGISAYAAPVAAYWTYSTGYVTVSGTAVSGYGTDWDNSTEYILAGDYIVIDADGSGDGPEEIEIASVDDHNSITLTSAPTGTYTATEHMEYGDCEDTNSPTLDGGTSNLAGGTWARSAAVTKGGAYSWVLTKTTAAGAGVAEVDLTDNVLTTDLHGLTAGNTYYISLWIYSDATVGASQVEVVEYYGAAWHTVTTFSNATQSAWELHSFEFTLNGSATAASLGLSIHTDEAVGTVLYLDDISISDVGADYSIRRRFNVDPDFLLDYTSVVNTLVIADHKRPPYAYDGSTFGLYDSDITYIPGAITYFGSRLWMGNTIESNVHYKTRLRWSSPTDLTSFSAADYLDLDKTKGVGVIKRLISLNRWLVAYLNDEVFIGTPSNLTDLPYSFHPVDTGRIGLIGSRAVASIPNAHVFVGQNDVYTLSTEGVKSIKCPVTRSLIDNCADPSRIFAVTDTKNDRVVFGVPEGGSYIAKIWSWDFKTNGWSYEDVSATSLSNPGLQLQITWDDLPAILSVDNWDTGMADFANWDSIGGATSTDSLFRSEDGYTYQLGDRGTTDISSGVTATFETGDMDLDKPDTHKTFLRFSLRLKERPSSALQFVISYSVNGGYTWTNGGYLRITASQIEGKVDFIATGSTLRVRCTESSVHRYSIVEIGIRYRDRGIEYVY